MFACLKPFIGHIAVIQRNAITSWTLLNPRPDIILCGDEAGVREIAQEFSLRHLPDILRNEYGTPLLNDLFKKAESASVTDLLCYINSDIILFNDFMQALERVSKLRRRFLMCGQRWNFDIQELIDFGAGWDKRLRAEVMQKGVIDLREAVDFFVFPRGLLGEMPPLALGRLYWDSWILFRARSAGASLIDVTQVVIAVHQKHDAPYYGQRLNSIRSGPEGRRNLDLAGPDGSFFSLGDAPYVLTPSGLKLAIDFLHISRHAVTLPIFYPSLRFPAWILSKFVALYWRIFIRRRLFT